MIPSVKVDTSAFNSAFKRYLKVTSRDMVTALNGKHRDVMFMAAKYAPFNRTEFSAEDYERNRSQAYITHKTIQRYGENPPGSAKSRRILKSGNTAKNKGNTLGPGQKWNMVMRNKIAARLRKRHSGQRGYMASAFIKAGLKFAPAAGKVARPRQKYKGANTGGSVQPATPGKFVSSVILHWSAKSSADADAKERLASLGVNAGLREVTADMENWMAGRMNRTAREVSS